MDTKQYNFSKDEALFELFLRSSKEVEDFLRMCWDETGCGAPYLTASRVKAEISMAKRCIDQFLGALAREIHAFIPFVVAWYVAEGVDIAKVEYFNGFVVLHLRRTIMNKREKGIALFNSPEKITLEPEYEFCEIWILTKQRQGGEHRCSVRGVAEIQFLLMSLFTFQYVDTYFWDIIHVPNLRNVVMEVLQKDAGLEWEQIYQTGERWKRFCDVLT